MKTTHKKHLVFALIFSLIGLIGHTQSAETGLASFYSDKFEGKKTASGELYTASKMTAAHRTLPFGTRVKVTNLSNNRSVVVTVNDRGPFVKNRVIDLSRAAAKKLGYIEQGVAEVKLEPISNK